MLLIMLILDCSDQALWIQISLGVTNRCGQIIMVLKLAVGLSQLRDLLHRLDTCLRMLLVHSSLFK